jgi:AP-1 complex subunit gamma-1
MLNYLLVSEADFLQDLTWKICTSIEKYSPNRRWYIDTLIRVLTLSGNYVKDESISSLTHLISSTPQLQTYSVHKIFFSLRENINQEGLIKVGLWCLGEFGGLLVNGKAVGPDNTPITVTEEEVVDLIEKILTKSNVSDVCKEYAVTCMIKLYPKFKTQTKKIVNMIDSQTTSSSLEVQQRACEYLKLIEKEWDENRAAILETMPVCPSFTAGFSDKNVGDVEIDEVPPQQHVPAVVLRTLGAEAQQIKPAAPVNNANNHAGGLGNLIDLDDLLSKPHNETNLTVNTQQTSVQNNNSNTNEMNLNVLNDIFASTTSPVNVSPNLTSPNAMGNFMSLYGSNNQNLSSPIGNLGTSNMSNVGLMGNQPANFNVNLTKTVDLMETGDLLGGGSKDQNFGQQSFKAFEDTNIELMFQCIKV